MRKTLFSIVLVLITIVSAINIFFSYQIKYVIDALTEKNESLFYTQISYLLVIIVIMLICEYFRQVLDTIYLNKIGFSIHKTLIGRAFKYNNFGKNLLSKVNNDIETIKEQYYNTIFSLYQGIIYFIFATIALFKLDILTASWVILLSIVPITIPNIFKKLLKKFQNEISNKKSNYNDKLESYLEGLLVIKNSDSTGIFYEKLLEEYNKINRYVNLKNSLSSLVNVLTGFIFYVTIIVILYIGGKQAIAGNTSIGDIVSIFTISAELVMPVNLITSSIANIQSVEDIKKELVVKENFVLKNIEKSVDFKNIEFRGVNYVFNNNFILKNFSANFEKGKKYLIQGESGSGKSTLALLLTKNLDGENIFINNKSINIYDYREIQKLIAYVPQESFLFKGTIFDNISFYKDVKESDVVELFKMTNLDNKFRTFFEIYEVVYDRKKSNLSGGEKQRLAIVRALLQNKQVVLLDETLSGLDKETYLRIEKYLLEMENTTLIHISHRSYEETIDLYDNVYKI